MKRPTGLLNFHAKMAQMLKVARSVGSVGTAASYRSALMHNARVLRRKLLGVEKAERFHVKHSSLSQVKP